MPGGDIDVRTVRENLEYALEEFARLERPAAPTEDYCEALALAQKRRRMYAISRLLTEADSGAFFEHLGNAARLRVDLLEWAPGAGEELERYTYVGNDDAFFDALAAGDVATAKRIAELAEARFDRDFEYAEDYAYRRFLFELAQADFRTAASLQPLLDALNDALAGDVSPRYAICKALLEGEGTVFLESLTDLIAEHEMLFEKKGQGLIADKHEFATERFVFVEGLALKFIAASVGLPIEAEDRCMPREACWAALRS